MSILWHRGSVVALLIAIGVGIIYVGADRTPRRRLDIGQQVTLTSQLSDFYLEDEELEHRRQLLMQRVAAKQVVVRELLDGRLSLVEAAARFRDIEEAQPFPWDLLRSNPASGERHCRNVISLAEGWLETNRPAQLAGRVAGLEAELEQHRGPDGVIHLPQ